MLSYKPVLPQAAPYRDFGKGEGLVGLQSKRHQRNYQKENKPNFRIGSQQITNYLNKQNGLPIYHLENKQKNNLPEIKINVKKYTNIQN